MKTKFMEIEIKGTLRFLMDEDENSKQAANRAVKRAEQKVNKEPSSLEIHLENTSSTVKEIR